MALIKSDNCEKLQYTFWREIKLKFVRKLLSESNHTLTVVKQRHMAMYFTYRNALVEANVF